MNIESVINISILIMIFTSMITMFISLRSTIITSFYSDIIRKNGAEVWQLMPDIHKILFDVKTIRLKKRLNYELMKARSINKARKA